MTEFWWGARELSSKYPRRSFKITYDVSLILARCVRNNAKNTKSSWYSTHFLWENNLCKIVQNFLCACLWEYQIPLFSNTHKKKKNLASNMLSGKDKKLVTIAHFLIRKLLIDRLYCRNYNEYLLIC